MISLDFMMMHVGFGAKAGFELRNYPDLSLWNLNKKSETFMASDFFICGVPDMMKIGTGLSLFNSF